MEKAPEAVQAKNCWRVVRDVHVSDLENTLNQLASDGYLLYRLDERARPDASDNYYTTPYFNIIGCVPGCVPL